jgi:hybrid cluster-associated redox disulfide protein
MTAITPELLVDEAMKQWPETIRVFLDYGFHCVGCPIGCFHSVAEACQEHHTELDRFLQALQLAATTSGCVSDARGSVNL